MSKPPQDAKSLAAYLESTLLKPDATTAELERLCCEARDLSFVAVSVHGSQVVQAVHLLEESVVKIGTVVGFPLGGADSDVKRYETEVAVDNGAQEIDLVINSGWLKDGRGRDIVRELRDVVEAADERPVKVILETGLLTREEIVRACHLVVESEAHFVKTSTGFGPRGASLEDVRLLRETVGPEFGVKAAGGIRDTATALAMIEAGANRIGTSTAAEIMRGFILAH